MNDVVLAIIIGVGVAAPLTALYYLTSKQTRDAIKENKERDIFLARYEAPTVLDRMLEEYNKENK